MTLDGAKVGTVGGGRRGRNRGVPPGPVPWLSATMIAMWQCLAGWIGPGTMMLAVGLSAQGEPPRLQFEREVALSGGAATAIDWSDEGRWVAVGGECGEVLVLDATTSAVQCELLVAGAAIRRLQFAPDARALLVAAADVSSWSLPSATRMGRWSSAAPMAAGWHPDGSCFAMVAATGAVQILDPGSGAVQFEWAAAREVVTALALAPDGERIAIGTADGVRRVIDRRSGDVLDTRRLAFAVSGLAFTTDERLLCLCDFELFGERVEAGPRRFRQAMSVLEPLPGASAGLVTGRVGEAVLFRDGQPNRELPAAGPIALAADGERYVVATRSHLQWHEADGAVRTTPLSLRRSVPPMLLSRDGRWLLLQAKDQRAECIDLTAAALAAVPLPEAVLGTAVAAVGGDRFAFTRRSPIGGIWMETWAMAAAAAGAVKPLARRTLAPPAQWNELPRFSPDGRWFTYGDRGYDGGGQRIVWRQTVAPGQGLLVGNDGNQVLALRRGGSGLHHPFTLESRASDGTVADSIGLQHCEQAQLSPDCAHVLVRGGRKLTMFSVPALAAVGDEATDIDDAVWLDGKHLLTIEGGGTALAVRGLNGSVARVPMPLVRPAQRLAVAGAADRVVVALVDRLLVFSVRR
jgi:hypothetical protein